VEPLHIQSGLPGGHRFGLQFPTTTHGYANPPGPVIAGTVRGAGIGGFMLTKILCNTHRVYSRGFYLIAIYTTLDSEKNRDVGGPGPSCHHSPMARAVMDDFGDLVIVRGWL